MQRSAELFERACRVLPGGVNSPVRAYRAVGGTPRFIVSATGCHLVDVDGNRLIDYVGSWGAMIAGHAHPSVVEIIQRAAAAGTSYGTPTPAEVELAEEMTRRVPGLERVRMVSSGTEAVMSAVRLARAATSRNKIVKFDGCYHGHADALLVRAGSGVATFGLPDSPGVPANAAADTLSLPYNDLSAVEAAFDLHGKDIAAILVEPIAGNMGVVPPMDGFLDGLREVTRRTGSILIFDEVMTGFRVSRGGAAELLGLTSDLYTFAKIVGGGVPAGAFGGRGDLMRLIAPEGPVYQAGTLSGNPLATAAGLATLQLLDHAAYARLEALGGRLASGLARVLADARVPGVVQRVGSMLTLFFSERRVAGLVDATRADHERFARFFHGMLERGVHLPPSGYEAWFLSLAHDEAIIDETIDAARAALRAIT